MSADPLNSEVSELVIGVKDCHWDRNIITKTTKRYKQPANSSSQSQSLFFLTLPTSIFCFNQKLEVQILVAFTKEMHGAPTSFQVKKTHQR